MTRVEQILNDRMLGNLSHNQALAALIMAGRTDAVALLGEVHISRSPLLGARGAHRDLGHDVTRVDLRRTP